MTEVVPEESILEIYTFVNGVEELRAGPLVLARKIRIWDLCFLESNVRSDNAQVKSIRAARADNLLRIWVQSEMNSAYPVHTWLAEVFSDERLPSVDRFVLRYIFSPHAKLPIPFDRASLGHGQLEYLEGDPFPLLP